MNGDKAFVYTWNTYDNEAYGQASLRHKKKVQMTFLFKGGYVFYIVSQDGFRFGELAQTKRWRPSPN